LLLIFLLIFTSNGAQSFEVFQSLDEKVRCYTLTQKTWRYASVRYNRSVNECFWISWVAYRGRGL